MTVNPFGTVQVKNRDSMTPNKNLDEHFEICSALRISSLQFMQSPY